VGTDSHYNWVFTYNHFLLVGKQFDALLIDTSAPSPSNPVFDTTPSDTTMVSIANIPFERLESGL